MGPPYATGSAAPVPRDRRRGVLGSPATARNPSSVSRPAEIDIRTGASIRPILGFNLTSQPYRRPRSRRWRGPDRGEQLAVNGPVPDVILAEPRGLRLSRPACFRLGCGSLATRFQIARVTKSVNAKRVRNGIALGGRAGFAADSCRAIGAIARGSLQECDTEDGMHWQRNDSR